VIPAMPNTVPVIWRAYLASPPPISTAVGAARSSVYFRMHRGSQGRPFDRQLAVLRQASNPSPRTSLFGIGP
jgi:hypothetical protein